MWPISLTHLVRVALVSAMLATGGAASAQPDPAPTFNRDLAPVIFKHCSSCHRPGAVGPFPLLTFEDVRARARQVVQAVVSRAMPPWKATTGVGEFEGSRRLTDAQVALFERWLDHGALRGDPRDLPPAPAWSDEWALGPPDLVVRMDAPYRLAPGGGDHLRNFALPVPLSSTRYVRAWEFRTTGRQAVHHATLMVDPAAAARRIDAADPEPGYEGLIPLSAQSPEGYFLGWTPGQKPYEAAPDLAWRLDPGSDLIVMLHLQPTGSWESIEASVALYFTDHAPSKVPVMVRLNRQDLDIPPGDANVVAVDEYTLPVDVDLYGLQPHAHYLARDVRGDARLPDGTTRSLIHVQPWDFHWQDVYRYRAPVRLPAGTRLRMAFTYDNSTANRANPAQPPRRVIFGQRSTDEMADLWLQVVPVAAADRARLVSDLRRKLLPQNIDGYRKMIEADPDNPALHDDLALLGIEAGNVDLAVSAFRTALRLRPGSAASSYNLANALLLQKRPSEAIQHFREALRVDPAHGLAHQGLGLALAATGALAEGATEVERAVALLPDSTDARYNLGVLRQAQGRPDDALAQYREVMRVAPTHADAAYAAGVIHEARGDDRATAQAFRQALSARAAWTPALRELAWTLAVTADGALRDPREALELAQQASRAGSRDARTADVLAAALAANGSFDEAVAAMLDALRLMPDGADAARRSDMQSRLAMYRQRQPYVSLRR